jgi:L-lactate dehydrogenase (cytochrome)
MDINRKYPDIDALERGGEKRVPKFTWDYLIGGAGSESCVARNRTALDRVLLRPQYLSSTGNPNLTVQLMGRVYDLPFGVSPVGLGGLIWPHAAEMLATSARNANIPFCLSAFANTSLEAIADLAPEHAWFQHYVTRRPELEKDMLRRLVSAGYRTMVVTIDVPTSARRLRDIRNGLTDPVRVSPRMFFQCLGKPSWAMATAKAGMPVFENLIRYAPTNASLADLSSFLGEVLDGHITSETLKSVRDAWPGKLVVKGVLDPVDVEKCRQLGVDAIVVSNHGGRQLDAAPTALEVITDIREAAGKEMAIIADGGVRSGLDITRMLASGADFVLLGRAFMYGVAALGPAGGDYVISLLRKELHSTMAQIGCQTIAELPRFLVR